MTLRTVLLSLQALLSAAEADDPQDAVVATQYKENQEMFVKTARHWTNVYAGCEFTEMIKLMYSYSIATYVVVFLTKSTHQGSRVRCQGAATYRYGHFRKRGTRRALEV